MTAEYIAGVDEAGRGPLAGPVVAAAVIFSPDTQFDGLTDSKKLTEAKRESLYSDICQQVLAWTVCILDHDVIDKLNIFQATMRAMRDCVTRLDPLPTQALIDGNHAPALPCPARAIVKGDASEPVISAASVIAKVTRDRIMHDLDRDYPGYGFARHKGYPTAAHLQALTELGPCPVHRRSYAPVQAAYEARQQPLI